MHVIIFDNDIYGMITDKMRNIMHSNNFLVCKIVHVKVLFLILPRLFTFHWVLDIDPVYQWKKSHAHSIQMRTPKDIDKNCGFRHVDNILTKL